MAELERLSYSEARSCAGEREETARWAQLDLIVKALAPLWGFRQRGGRGLCPWGKGETGAPPAQAPEV